MRDFTSSFQGIGNPLGVVGVISSEVVKFWRWLWTTSEGPEDKPGKRAVNMAGWYMGGGQSHERALERDKGLVGCSGQ